MLFQRLTIRSIYLVLLCNTVAVGHANDDLQCSKVHWRERAYDNSVMIRYKPYVNCIQWSAWQFKLPEELLYSVIYQERGDVGGKCSSNSNKTKDCGPGQINDVRMPELRPFGLTRDDIRLVPCRNIWAVGFLLRKEIDAAKGDFWLGVGNYHAQYRLKPRTHAIYVRKIYAAWHKLIGTMAGC